MAVVKYSRQRESIRKNIMNRHDHPTADMVYQDIQKEYPHISLGTVYRNLSLLAKLGEIRKLTLGDGPDRFDGMVTPHSHFACTNCGCLIDFPVDQPLEQLQKQANDQFDGRVDGFQIQFYGLCAACSQKSELSSKT